MVEYAGKDVEAAARFVIEQRLASLGGQGGVIAVDRSGRVTCVFNTELMYRGIVTARITPQVGVFADA